MLFVPLYHWIGNQPNRGRTGWWKSGLHSALYFLYKSPIYWEYDNRTYILL